ncbi:MAG: hypothetical protein Q9219_006233 [cf. Caloplaca sp. 3 TL-2023]
MLPVPEDLIYYIAQEEEGGGAESTLDHYLGVYDPQSHQLQLVRARKLVLRSKIRPSPSTKEKESEPTSALSARNTLGLTFGTKKSQRAIEAITKNAISPIKSGRVAADQTQSALDPIASAVVTSMAPTSSMPSREEIQAAADDSKPRPRPNLDAETPADVYPIDTLAGPGTLRQMTIREWQDAVENGEEILTKSRFVSHRIQAIVSGGDVRKLKTLKYLLLLLEFHNALGPSNRDGGRSIPPREKLKTELGNWSSALVEGVTHRFSGGGDHRALTRWYLDFLITHICALALTVDGFHCDTYDLMLDLRLEGKDMRKYAREIGCRVDGMTEGEMKKWGVGREGAKGRVVARLRLPLEFPRMRVAVGRKKR